MNPIIREIALQLGFLPYQVRKWKMRNAVPHKHRQPILAAAQKKGARLAFAEFEFAPAKKATKRQRKTAA